MAPFDITITDNKTKSQAKFYSLNVDSVQNSMGFPFNPKFSFEPVDGFVDNGLFLDSPLNNDPGFTNDVSSNNNNGQSSSGSNNGNSGQSSSGNDLEIDIEVAKDPIGRGDRQTIEVSVSDADTDENIAGADVDGTVKYATNIDYDKGNFKGITDGDGKIEHEWQIGGGSNEGTFNVIVKVDANGYKSQTETTTFKVVDKDKLTNSTEGQDNSTSIEENSTTLANDGQDESNDNLNCGDIDETNIPVGNNDPNNLDADGDGIGCDRNNDNDEGIPLVDLSKEPVDPAIPLVDIDTATQDRDGDGVVENTTGEQQSEEQEQAGNDEQQQQDTNNNGSDDDEEDTDENASEENNEQQDNNEEENNDGSDNANNE
ncbi:MAG: hypothetical protein M3Q77_02495 [Thermoproteota archaeon]|nr:hypothetical protein [Thermoproteota archaeon]